MVDQKPAAMGACARVMAGQIAGEDELGRVICRGARRTAGRREVQGGQAGRVCGSLPSVGGLRYGATPMHASVYVPAPGPPGPDPLCARSGVGGDLDCDVLGRACRR